MPCKNKYKVGELDIQEAFGIIETSKNPEIHHYNHGFHPGARWYIKTIIPDRKIIQDSCLPLVDAWWTFAEQNASVIRITDVSFNWNGDRIPGWNTIWLDQRIDVSWYCDRDTPTFKIIEHDAGIRSSAEKLNLYFDQATGDQDEIEKLREVAAMLGSYASKDHITKKRATIRVLE